MEPGLTLIGNQNILFEERMFLKGVGGNDSPGDDPIESGSEAVAETSKNRFGIGKKDEGM